MATGYSRSILGGHDAIYDYCCTTCEGENLNAKALYYCKDCSQLFCEPCKKFHDKFTREHRVLGRKELTKWGIVKPVARSVMCDEHPGKELEMFCEDHDQLCCSICIGVKHRACKQVKAVLEVARGIQRNSRFKSFLSEAAKTQSGLKHLNDKQENSIKLLQKARGEITSILINMRKHFNQIVDRLEEKSTAEMDKLLTMLREKITSDKNIFADVHDKIQKFLHDVQDLGKQCDELTFQGYKKCCEQVASAKVLLSSMQDVDYKLEFTPDAKIKQYLSSLESLGTFHVTPSGHVDKLEKTEPTKPLTLPDHVYSVGNNKTYNVRTRGDTMTCLIRGMCQISNGQTAIVDSNNSKVKLLGSSTFSVLNILKLHGSHEYCVLDELKLPDCPRDICPTTGTELAVTVCDWGYRNEIQFINASNEKLSSTRTVKLDHKCEGIAYHIDQLYVGSDTALYVYSLSGKKIRKLYKNTVCGITVRKFSLSDDGSRIYVTNFTDHLLITLDSSGHRLSTLSDSELRGPTGVCMADNGSVFVCDVNSNTVLQVDREGRRRMTTLATLDDGVFCPKSLCYDWKRHTLLVGQLDDNLLALQLK